MKKIAYEYCEDDIDYEYCEDVKDKENEQDNFITLYNKALNTNSNLFLRTGNYYIKVFDFHKYLSFPTDFCYYESDSTFFKIPINKQATIILKKVKYISHSVAPYNLKNLIQIIFQRSAWELIEINNDDLINGYNSIILNQKVNSDIISIELVEKNKIKVIINEENNLICKYFKIENLN